MANGSSRKRSATPARKPKPTSPSKSSAKSPMKRASTGGSKPESPKAVGKKNSAGARGADILDQAIDAVTMWGLLSVVALFAAIAVQFDLYTELEPLLTLSSLMMGMGKGGVAGFSTMASAMAAAAAPDGKVSSLDKMFEAYVLSGSYHHVNIIPYCMIIACRPYYDRT